MNPPSPSQRSFVKASISLAGATPLISGSIQAEPGVTAKPLRAYVGTFSSPLSDVLQTQVGLLPGNGRGIQLFQVNRAAGTLTAAGVHESGTSPCCLLLNTSGTRLYSANEADLGSKDKEGTVSAFSIGRTDGKLKPLNTVRSGRADPAFVSIPPSGHYILAVNYFGGSVAVLQILPDGSLGDPHGCQDRCR